MERSNRVNRSEWVSNMALKSGAHSASYTPRIKRAKKRESFITRLFRWFV